MKNFADSVRRKGDKFSGQLNKCLNEKRRRESENSYLEELQSLVSIEASNLNSMAVKPDKSSVLNEAVLQIRRIRNNEDMCGSPNGQQQDEVTSSGFSTGSSNKIIAPMLLKALESFMLTISSDAKIREVSDSVTALLRFLPREMINTSIYNFIHHGDHNKFSSTFSSLSLGSGVQWNSSDMDSQNSKSCVCRFVLKLEDDATRSKMQEFIQMEISHIQNNNSINDNGDSHWQRDQMFMVRKVNVVENSALEQFTLRIDRMAKILAIDVSGVSSMSIKNWSQEAKGSNYLLYCPDKDKIRHHINNVLQLGSDTSGCFQLQVGPEKQVTVQSRSKLFTFPQNIEKEFIMSTLFVVKDTLDSNSLTTEVPSFPTPTISPTAPPDFSDMLFSNPWESPVSLHDNLGYSFSPSFPKDSSAGPISRDDNASRDSFKEEDGLRILLNVEESPADNDSNQHLLKRLLGVEDQTRSPKQENYMYSNQQGASPEEVSMQQALEEQYQQSANKNNPSIPKPQLAGQNPMLAQMLAQTPQTGPMVPTSIANSIMSQLPQDRLPKNLEKKLQHTPRPTGLGGYEDLPDFLDQLEPPESRASPDASSQLAIANFFKNLPKDKNKALELIKSEYLDITLFGGPSPTKELSIQTPPTTPIQPTISPHQGQTPPYPGPGGGVYPPQQQVPPAYRQQMMQQRATHGNEPFYMVARDKRGMERKTRMDGQQVPQQHPARYLARQQQMPRYQPQQPPPQQLSHDTSYITSSTPSQDTRYGPPNYPQSMYNNPTQPSPANGNSYAPTPPMYNNNNNRYSWQPQQQNPLLNAQLSQGNYTNAPARMAPTPRPQIKSYPEGYNPMWNSAPVRMRPTQANRANYMAASPDPNLLSPGSNYQYPTSKPLEYNVDTTLDRNRNVLNGTMSSDFVRQELRNVVGARSHSQGQPLNQEDIDAIGISLDLEQGTPDANSALLSSTGNMHSSITTESIKSDQKKSLLQQLLSEPP